MGRLGSQRFNGGWISPRPFRYLTTPSHEYALPSSSVRNHTHSCGMLGLLHLCFLHDHNADNAARLYRLSRSGRQEFPLAVVSLNITKWTMQVRAEQLAPFARRMHARMCALYVMIPP